MSYFVLSSIQLKEGKKQVSLLALAETIAASSLGAWIAFQWNFSALLLSSLVLTLFVHLRSARSAKLAAVKLANYSSGGSHYIGLDVLVIVLASLIGILLWKSVGWFSIILATAAGLLLLFLLDRFFVLPLQRMNSLRGDPSASHKALVRLLMIPLALGFSLNLLVKAVAARFFSVVYYLGDGIRAIPTNWSALVLRTDLMTPPEILPDLKSDHPLRFQNLVRNREGRIGSLIIGRESVILLIVLTFLPSIIYRLILKSSFFVYYPLLWLASAPPELRMADGTLVWDGARGRSLFDWFALLAAILSAAFIISKSWNQEISQYSTSWLESHGVPSYFPAQILGLDPAKLTAWDLAPFLSASLSIIVLLWASSIHARTTYRVKYSPTQIEIRLLYLIGKIRNLLTIATVALGLFAILFFLLQHCRFPIVLSERVSYFFQIPDNCFENYPISSALP